MKTKNKHVTVLLGGWNDEAEVSLSSGKEVVKSLQELGYDVLAINAPKCLKKLIASIPDKTDIIFNALHGNGVEDGNLQGVLNLLGIPYTHSGLLSSALAMNKFFSKALFLQNNIPTPRGNIFSIKEIRKNHVFSFPYVIKPIQEGSSIGVYIIKEGDPIPKLPDWHFGEQALVEEYIPGREIFISIMDKKTLSPVEIKPKQGFYDYKAKYTKGLTEYLCPAPISKEIQKEAERIALKSFDVLGCRGLIRCDIRYDTSRAPGKQLYLLEVNTQPGFTPLSLVPRAAKESGISYKDLVQWLIENAQCDANL